jgi:choline transport protein
MAQGLIVLTDSSYEPKPWQSVMLYWGVILFGVIINTVVSSWLPKFEGLILILHIIGFFAIILPLVILGPHASAKEVFTTFINTGDWSSQGLSFFVGLIGNVYAFFGADGAIHMSEEIQHASIVVPRAIISSIILNGVMGFGIALALLFCIGDIEAALKTKTGFPFIEIFQQAVQSVTGAALMTSIIVALSLCATVGIVASTSRQMWSFSRDRALPGWRYLQRVDPKSAVPVLAVVVTTVFSCLLALIVLGSSTAFNDIVSLSVVGLFSSYLMVACLLLWRRVRGDIKLYDNTEIYTNQSPWRTAYVGSLARPRDRGHRD